MKNWSVVVRRMFKAIMDEPVIPPTMSFALLGLAWIIAGNQLLRLVRFDRFLFTQGQVEFAKDLLFLGGATVFVFIFLHKMSERLQVMEDESASLFRESAKPMAIIKIADLRFVRVNDAALQLFGYTSFEFLSITFCALNLPKDTGGSVDPYAMIKAGFADAGTWHLTRRNRDPFYCHIFAQKIGKDGLMLLMFSDVDRLARSEERMRAATQQASRQVTAQMVRLQSRVDELEFREQQLMKVNEDLIQVNEQLQRTNLRIFDEAGRMGIKGMFLDHFALNTPVAAWSYNTSANQWDFVTPSIENLFGVPAHLATDPLFWMEQIDEDKRASISHHLRQLQDVGYVHFDSALKHNGTRAVSFFLRLSTDPSGLVHHSGIAWTSVAGPARVENAGENARRPVPE